MSKSIIAVLVSSIIAAALPAGAAELAIAIPDVASAEGRIRVAVYDNAASFRGKPMRALSVPATLGAMQLRIKDLPAGDYAFAIDHDANRNGKLDRILLGMPSEDYAFSNNAAGERGPPEFEQARVPPPAGGATTPSTCAKGAIMRSRRQFISLGTLGMVPAPAQADSETQRRFHAALERDPRLSVYADTVGELSGDAGTAREARLLGVSEFPRVAPQVVSVRHRKLLVPRRGARSETDCYLVGAAQDTRRGQTVLTVFEAHSIAAGPRALARLPYRAPVCFHGNFLTA